MRVIIALMLLVSGTAQAHYDLQPTTTTMRHYYYHYVCGDKQQTPGDLESCTTDTVQDSIICEASTWNDTSNYWYFKWDNSPPYNCISQSTVVFYEEHCDWDEESPDGGGECTIRNDACVAEAQANNYISWVTLDSNITPGVPGYNAQEANPVTGAPGIDSPFIPGCSYAITATSEYTPDLNFENITVIATGDMHVDEYGLPRSPDNTDYAEDCIPPAHNFVDGSDDYWSQVGCGDPNEAGNTDNGGDDDTIDPNDPRLDTELLRSIDDELDEIDTNTERIADKLDEMTEDAANPAAADVLIGEAELEAHMDDQEADILDQAGEDMTADLDLLGGAFSGAIFGDQSCSDINIVWPDFTMTFACADYQWLRDLLTWALYIATAIYLYRTATDPIGV